MIFLIVLIVIIIGIAVTLVIVGLRKPRTGEDAILQERLDEFTQKGEKITLEKIELSQPFTDRIIYPLAQKFGELAVKFTPQNALHSTEKKLELAGNPAKLDPTMFLALQFLAAIGFGAFLFVVFLFAKVAWPIGTRLLIVFVFVLLGFYFPQMWLSSKISRRQKEVRKAMPDALDLLTICVEAGLGFDAAMAKVSEKWENELSIAFARVIQEVQLGKLRRDAMRTMADRIGLSEMTSFVAAVIQSEQLGVSMAKVLRIQSEQMRVKRRQLAEEEAHKAPIKMLIPMGLLIFPSLMITLLTPAGLSLMHSALAGMFEKDGPLRNRAGLQKRPAFALYRMYRSIWQSLDWLFPPECGGCGKKGSRWCPACQLAIEPIGTDVCPICGDPYSNARICINCQQIPPTYQSLRSWAVFKGPLREALHHLKYRNDIGLGESLSRPLIDYLEELNWKIDLIVPVPLGKKRMKQRGYNQAALLARPIALAHTIDYSSKALLRVKEIPSQVGLTVNQRRLNVSGAFGANPFAVRGRSVLIIDDVTTTGATIESCAQALKELGARDIFALTLARTILGRRASDSS